MTGAEKAERINQIPHEIKKLKKDKAACEKKYWFSQAARIQLQISSLEKEFGELYHTIGISEV